MYLELIEATLHKEETVSYKIGAVRALLKIESPGGGLVLETARKLVGVGLRARYVV